MADINEEQVFKAFGLGAKAQEPAAPAVTEEPKTEGVQAQEIAAPAEAGEQTGGGAQTEPTAVAGTPEEPENIAATGAHTDKLPLTPEQRRENAARRRQQEQARQQTAIDQAVQLALKQERSKHESEMKSFFGAAGLKNTVTGEPITSMEQFNAWQKQFADARLERELKAGKLSQEGLATAIGNHPIVQQAKQLVDQAAAAKEAEQTSAAKTKIESEIAQIHKIDESINSLEDLTKAPYWPQLYGMTRRGYSLKDAHFLLNYERLEQAKMEAARQQAMLNARGKDHLGASSTPRGGGAASVPAADMAMFRLFNPGATDAEIQAYYNKNKKG